MNEGAKLRGFDPGYTILPLHMARKADVMDLEGPPRKREAVDVEQIGSPQKRSEGLSIDDIKGLLASHGQEMLKAQKEDIGAAVQNAVARSEKRTLGALEDIKKGLMQECERTRLEVTEIAKEQKSMRSVQSDLLARVAKLESKPSSSGSATASDGDRRPALVFGGWAPAARRNVVLGDLKALLSHVAAEELLDEQPWTPGPRRGVALAGFRIRAGETEEDMRLRMVEVMNLVNKASIPTEHTLDGRPVWSTISRNRAQRVEGSHASKVRRVLPSLQLAMDNVDTDYKEGSVWRDDVLIGSATRPEPHGVKTAKGKTEGSWFSPELLAKGAGINEDVVTSAWQQAIQN